MTITGSTASRFHKGERIIQSRVGVRDKMDRYGEMGIRDFLPEQHREFYCLLPLFLVGSVDDAGRPWASPLVGQPGFVSSPDPRTLDIRAWPRGWDPLASSLRQGAAIGGLGLEFNTRRRNRINGRAARVRPGEGFTLSVDQTFGNCPQYIQARQYAWLASPTAPAPTIVGESVLTQPVLALIDRADTLFIATAYGDDDWAANHGVDVSHRGGLPGFVAAPDHQSLRIPDYRGNFFFNTLGNLTGNPRCGLLFIDFSTGDVAQLTGEAAVQWDVTEDEAGSGALRWIEFTILRSLYTARALPMIWEFLSFAPQFDAPGA